MSNLAVLEANERADEARHSLSTLQAEVATVNCHELVVPLKHCGGALVLCVTRGSALNEESIYAWLEPAKRSLPSRHAVASFEVVLERCLVQRDGMGDPMVRLGDATFVLDEPHALALERRFGFTAIMSDF